MKSWVDIEGGKVRQNVVCGNVCENVCVMGVFSLLQDLLEDY